MCEDQDRTPPESGAPAPGWSDIPTRGLEPDTAPPATRRAFDPALADTEPPTIFDETARRAPRALRLGLGGPPRDLPPGYIIDERFEVVRRLGAGSTGTVYLVNDLRLKDRKALKLMHPPLGDREAAARRFISEIKTLQQLSHENIIRVYDYGQTEEGGRSFFTMEYIDGVSLADLLKKKGGRLPLDRAAALMQQILEALACAHAQMAHRNLKPANIMVRPTGRAVLLNFGVFTSASSAGLAQPTAPALPSHYLAPEQRENPDCADARSDIYAAGAIFYQMITGQVPLADALPPSRVMHGIPRSVDKAIMKALAERPEERHPTCHAMIAAINRAITPGLPIARIVALVFVILALAVGVGVLWW